MDVETFQPTDAKEWQQASARFNAVQAQRAPDLKILVLHQFRHRVPLQNHIPKTI